MKKNKENLVIRSEQPQDYYETEYMTMKAFWNLHGPGCDEHLLVRRLRQDAIYVPEISRIAVLDGSVVGTIMYSKAELIYGELSREVLTFGPLCVDPAVQDYGVGGKLLKTTMQLAKDTGYQAIVIFGEPGYYPKHGFQTCDHFGITTMDGKNFDAFLGIELQPGALTNMEDEFGCKGRFKEGQVFETLTLEEADQMSDEFPKLLKLRLPGQWNYQNPSQEKDGYELVSAVQYKQAFQNMFYLYANELSKDNAKEKETEEFFADPSKNPYIILNEKRPIGLLVLSGTPAQETENDSLTIEELFLMTPYRGRGIAKDLMERVSRQAEMSCNFNTKNH